MITNVLPPFLWFTVYNSTELNLTSLSSLALRLLFSSSCTHLGKEMHVNSDYHGSDLFASLRRIVLTSP